MLPTDDIAYLKGVGPQRAKVLAAEAGIHTVGDLLTYFPFRHIDRSHTATIASLHEDSGLVVLQGTVNNMQTVSTGKHRERLTVDLFDGALTIQTGLSKPVAQQIKAEPRVELCAFDGTRWLRVAADAVEDPRVEAQEHMLEAYPSLRAMYAPGDGNTAVFRLVNAEATFSSFTAAPRTVRF